MHDCDSNNKILILNNKIIKNKILNINIKNKIILKYKNLIIKKWNIFKKIF